MDYLKLIHALFNFVIMVCFIHQGWRGWKIRTRRIAELPPDAIVIRGHRTNGPRLAIFAFCGFLFGAATTFLDHGHIGRYPAHFLTGALLLCLIGMVYLQSRQIKGRGPQGRNVHAAFGIIVLALYPIQLLLGLGVLL